MRDRKLIYSKQICEVSVQSESDSDSHCLICSCFNFYGLHFLQACVPLTHCVGQLLCDIKTEITKNSDHSYINVVY